MTSKKQEAKEQSKEQYEKARNDARKNFEAVANFTSSYLGGISMWVDSDTVRFRESEKYRYYNASTEPISLKKAGILRHMLKELIIEFRGACDLDSSTWHYNVHFAYKHFDGGSNGHELDFRLKVRDGQVMMVVNE